MPISYLDLNALATDSTFLRRVQIAVAKFAEYILNESPSAANHPARYAWAKNAIMNTPGMANALAPAVVTDSAVGAAPPGHHRRAASSGRRVRGATTGALRSPARRRRPWRWLPQRVSATRLSRCGRGRGVADPFAAASRTSMISSSL